MSYDIFCLGHNAAHHVFFATARDAARRMSERSPETFRVLDHSDARELVAYSDGRTCIGEDRAHYDCPYCRSSDIYTSGVGGGDEWTFLSKRCGGCDCSWSEKHRAHRESAWGRRP